MSGIAFQNVGGLKPNRTRFDWTFSKKFDTDFGWIVPIMTQFCLPGDHYTIDVATLVRCLPLSAPVMHRGQIKTDFFFIPKRIIDDCNSRPGTGNPKGDPLLLNGSSPPAGRFNWELFITGGFDGNDAQTHPTWDPDDATSDNSYGDTANSNPSGYTKGTLWDYLQYPVFNGATYSTYPSNTLPLDDLRRIYNLTFNEFFRDETLWTTEWAKYPKGFCPTGSYTVLPWENEKICFSAWGKDYFTSALPFQQRGISPALPLSGNLALDFTNATINTNSLTGWIGLDTTATSIGASNTFPPTTGQPSNQTQQLITALNRGSANLGSGITYDIADFRLTFQIQKWLERNARAGARINEWTKAHFGTDIRDESLYRPEYIGGTRSPIIFSEVLQTGETGNTPQGTMAGHGINADSGFVGAYECVEYGYILGLMRIMPDVAYSSQGFKRTNLYRTKYDFPQMEFVNLSEQDITNAEIMCDPTYPGEDSTLFGYQGMYDELRTQEDQVCGNFRDTLNYWHMNRIFSGTQKLNRQFIECNWDKSMRRIFYEQTAPGLLCNVEFNVKAIRPIPAIAEPGLIDHH